MADELDVFEVRLSPAYWVGFALLFYLGVIIGGVAWLLWTRRALPRRIDAAGITTLRGELLRWEELDSSDHTRWVSAPFGVHLTTELVLHFQARNVYLKSSLVRDYPAAVAAVQRQLSRRQNAAA